jgi:SAM-dependent methyltransferase
MEPSGGSQNDEAKRTHSPVRRRGVRWIGRPNDGVPVSRDDVRTNLEHWESYSDEYQAANEPQLNRWDRLGWGTWDVPEDEIHALGEVDGRRSLELGCGAAQFGIKVAMRGALVTGIDFSASQLRHARTNLRKTGVAMRLVRGSAEELPFADASVDLVFCDHNSKDVVHLARENTRSGDRRAGCLGESGADDIGRGQPPTAEKGRGLQQPGRPTPRSGEEQVAEGLEQ